VSTLSTPDVLRRTGGREITRVIFDSTAIARRVGELGRQITEAYPDGELLALGLLKGSFIFLADLVRTIERPVQVDFLVASSYGNDKVSSGNVRLLYDPAIDLEGKHVVLVEDIIDSGRTLQRLLGLLGERRPLSLAVCALLDKQLAPDLPELKFVGFGAPTAFLVGYGLDHAENYRHLPFIADLD
jgi:hypoxanthine phosphoribosyltransferase